MGLRVGAAKTGILGGTLVMLLSGILSTYCILLLLDTKAHAVCRRAGHEDLTG